MNVAVFGATGMVGQGVLLECLRDPSVTQAVAVGRTYAADINPLLRSPKLREIMHQNFLDFSGMEASLSDLDACFFCLGVSSAGMSEPDYTRITYDFTLAAAKVLAQLNPGMTFIYVTGAGTDSTEQGRTMWARVKGRTENALLRLPLKSFMFRPGLIQPLDGIRSKTPLYNTIYRAASPLVDLLHRTLPNHVLSTREIGQAMLAVARLGYVRPILETRDIRAVLTETSS